MAAGQTILRPKTFGAIVIRARAEREDSLFDIVGVVSKISPRIPIAVFDQRRINGCNIGRGVDVGHVRTKVKKVVPAVSWIPVKLLPTVGRVAQGASDWHILAAAIRPILVPMWK
jgi:hypothetical protein